MYLSLLVDDAPHNIEPVPLQALSHVHLATGGLSAQERQKIEAPFLQVLRIGISGFFAIVKKRQFELTSFLLKI